MAPKAEPAGKVRHLKVDLPQRIALGATKAEDPGALDAVFVPETTRIRGPEGRGAVRRVPGGRSDATTGRHPMERSGIGMPLGAAAKRRGWRDGVHLPLRKTAARRLPFSFRSGRWTRTTDLRVMSPTSYQLLYPAMFGTAKVAIFFYNPKKRSRVKPGMTNGGRDDYRIVMSISIRARVCGRVRRRMALTSAPSESLFCPSISMTWDIASGGVG